MKEEQYQRIYAEIDLEAIVENMRNMKALLEPQTKMLAVVKADAYGHGSVPVAQKLEALDFVFGFGVATSEEGCLLREAGVQKPILVLGYAFPDSYEMLIKDEIRLTVFRRELIGQLAEAAKKAGKPARVHIKVDTGMNRIGITPDREGLIFVKELMEQEQIEIEGIFTHFARADEADKSNAEEQLGTFQEFIHMIEEELSLRIPIKHCANSAAVLEMPKACMDMVRTGIAMYGIYPSKEVSRKSVHLLPALSLYSRIIYIKRIARGQSVSYGGTFTAEKDMRVATIPAGYGDGYPRGLSNKGYCLLHGKRASILGRICMDQLMIDVTEIPEAAEGDRVVLLGYDGAEHISAEDLGELSGRFHYELVCGFGRRVPRVYPKKVNSTPKSGNTVL